jgi:hypothetical protein
MYKIVCPVCGCFIEYTDEEVQGMEHMNKYGYIEKGLPYNIFCGYCQSEPENQVKSIVIKVNE